MPRKALAGLSTLRRGLIQKGQKQPSQNGLGSGCQRLASRTPLQGRKDKYMLNLNRVTLIGYIGADAKTAAVVIPTPVSLPEFPWKSAKPQTLFGILARKWSAFKC
jgi:hypothetical protein